MHAQSDKPSEDDSELEGCAAVLGLEELVESRATAEIWRDLQKSREDLPVVNEDEKLEIEHMQQEKQANVQRTQVEPARMWMDLPNCQANFVWAEESLAQKDVEHEHSRQELHIPVATEDERWQSEHVRGEEQAEHRRTRSELATTWMDLQSCRTDLMWAEKEVAEMDVENQQLTEELRKCKEDLARVQRQKEQMRHERKEEFAKAPTPLSHASREQQIALQR